jgi:hypothetical protein
MLSVPGDRVKALLRYFYYTSIVNTITDETGGRAREHRLRPRDDYNRDYNSRTPLEMVPAN